MTGTIITKTLSSGKTRYYIRLNFKQNGVWHTKTLSTGLEAKNNKRKAEALIPQYLDKYSYLEQTQINNTVFDSNVTLYNYLEAWLQSKRLNLRESTSEAYTFRVEKIKRYFKGSKIKLIDVSPAVIDEFFNYSLKFGKTNQKTGQKEALSVRSVRSYKSILNAVFNQAIIDVLISSNPVSCVRVHGKKNKDYSEEMLFMTELEISDFLHFLADKYPRLVGIAFMGAYYGLRRSEILGLKWDAIDFEKRTIAIQHTIVRVKQIQAGNVTKTNAGNRTLYLFEAATKCLQAIRNKQEEDRNFFGNSYANTSGYVFTWEDGRIYDPNYISREFKKASAAFGRPEITLHKLRHSCASMLINKGWDIKKLQYWLGHEDVQTTLNIYAHFNRERLNGSENDLAEISMSAADLFA